MSANPSDMLKTGNKIKKEKRQIPFAQTETGTHDEDDERSGMKAENTFGSLEVKRDRDE